MLTISPLLSFDSSTSKLWVGHDFDALCKMQCMKYFECASDSIKLHYSFMYAFVNIMSIPERFKKSPNPLLVLMNRDFDMWGKQKQLFFVQSKSETSFYSLFYTSLFLLKHKNTILMSSIQPWSVSSSHQLCTIMLSSLVTRISRRNIDFALWFLIWKTAF